MPQRPKKVCAAVGCNVLTRSTHCEECAPAAKLKREEAKRKRQRKIDKQRGSATARGYDSKWQRESKAYLNKNPFCVEHLKRGLHVPATVVDHIIPHKGDKKLFWDRKNWQGLCVSCHNRKTRTEDM